MIFSGIKDFFRASFGDLDREELKKFLLLGLMLGLLMGLYWTLRPMRDALFQAMVGSGHISRAHVLSLLIVFPLVMLYSKLVDMVPRHVLFYVVSCAYGLGLLVFAWFMVDPVIGLANITADPSRILGWAWFVFVESFGWLSLALLWALATDITTADSAKKGFYLVALIAQISGLGVMVPYLVTSIPTRFGVSNAYAVLVLGLLIFLIIPLVMFFRATLAPDRMIGFTEEGYEQDRPEPGVFKGLTLMFRQPYLLGILGLMMVYEVLVRKFGYYYKIMLLNMVGKMRILARIEHMGSYASYTQLATFLCLVLAIIIIYQRSRLTALLTLPIFMLGVIVLILKSNPLSGPLFWLLVVAKAISTTLIGPAKRQLFIPTTKGARYKSQAWIQGLASTVPSALGGLPIFTTIGSYTLGAIAIVGVLLAYYLGKTYQKAVDDNRIIS